LKNVKIQEKSYISDTSKIMIDFLNNNSENNLGKSSQILIFNPQQDLSRASHEKNKNKMKDGNNFKPFDEKTKQRCKMLERRSTLNKINTKKLHFIYKISFSLFPKAEICVS
jgi:hypothetical protein